MAINKMSKYKKLRKDFIDILEKLIEHKQQLAREYAEGKNLDALHESKDVKDVDTFFIVKDFKTMNDVYGLDTLKKIIVILKCDSKYWARGIRNLANTENKLSFLQTKNEEGYKLISFMLDYADKKNPWSDINQLGRIKLCCYENPSDHDAFHFLRTIITNNSFLSRYGVHYDREINKYIKSTYKLPFEVDESNSKLDGLRELLNLYMDCLEANEFENIPFDFDREYDSLYSLKEHVNEGTAFDIDSFLKRMMKVTGKNKIN